MRVAPPIATVRLYTSCELMSHALWSGNRFAASFYSTVQSTDYNVERKSNQNAARNVLAQ